MKLRGHRRDLVIWRSAGGYGELIPARPTRTRRIYRCVRIGTLLTVTGMVRFARVVAPRWRPLLAGTVLTVAGVVLRSGAWGATLLPGLLFLVYPALVPAADHKPRRELVSVLAGYSTPAQRRDLAATLDRYPDRDTHELRDILARQATAARANGIPGANSA